MTFLTEMAMSLAAMLATAAVPLLIYCWRSHGTDFVVRVFLFTNRARLLIGFALMAWISFVINIWPAAKTVIGAGLGAGATELAMGFVLGTMLVTFIPGNKL